jgi:hypothetical protein
MHNERPFKSLNQMLENYFTSSTVVIPQLSSNMYAFNIGDKVLIDALPKQRRDLSFKYSLNKGKRYLKFKF